MLQMIGSFHGNSNEDPSEHLSRFLEMCEIFKINKRVDKVSSDVKSIKKLLIQMAIYQGLEVEMPESSSTDADEDGPVEHDEDKGVNEDTTDKKARKSSGDEAMACGDPRAGPSETQAEASEFEYELEDD